MSIVDLFSKRFAGLSDWDLQCIRDLEQYISKLEKAIEGKKDTDWVTAPWGDARTELVSEHKKQIVCWREDIEAIKRSANDGG